MADRLEGSIWEGCDCNVLCPYRGDGDPDHDPCAWMRRNPALRTRHRACQRVHAMLCRPSLPGRLLLLAWLGLCLGGPAVGQGRILYPGQVFRVGETPVSVAMADLNRDGHLDLVTANQFSTNQFSADVSVLLGKGDGTFRAEQRFKVEGEPLAVAVGDVNGDRHLDLVTANGQGADTVSVLLGLGDGTFRAARHFGVGHGPVSVVVRDLNRDGHLDLVTANQFSADVSVVLGKGDGTFRAARHFAVGFVPVSLAVGDLNGDRHLDLVTAHNLSGGVSVVLGRGDGTFRPAQPFEMGYSPVSVVVRDLNGDRHLDLVTANANADNVAIRLGKGDGTFQAPQLFGVGDSPLAVAVADVNGDGRLDLVTVSSTAVASRYSADVSVVLGRGDGTFRAARHFVVGNQPAAVAVADVNGDGRRDLVIPDLLTDSVSVILGRGDGTFRVERRLEAESPATNIAVGAVGDVNGDEHLDVLTDNSGTVSVFLGRGDGTFRVGQSSGVRDSSGSMTLQDVNRDRHLDLVRLDVIRGGHVFLGNGDGTFQATKPFVTVSGALDNAVALGDVNEDGHMDLVTNKGKSLGVSLGRGNGTFLVPQPLPVPNVGSPLYFTLGVAIGDVNEDRHLDLVTSCSCEEHVVLVYLGRGDGTFRAARAFAVAPGVWASIAVGDLNGDGHLDVVTASTDTDRVSVLFGRGDGTLRAPQYFGVGDFPGALAVADVNGDGHLDVVTANRDSIDVSVLVGRGDGTFRAARHFGVGASGTLAVADVNENGRLDLITGVSVLLQ